MRDDAVLRRALPLGRGLWYGITERLAVAVKNIKSADFFAKKKDWPRLLHTPQDGAKFTEIDKN